MVTKSIPEAYVFIVNVKRRKDNTVGSMQINMGVTFPEKIARYIEKDGSEMFYTMRRLIETAGKLNDAEANKI